ncbi:hypothetical protein JKG68_21485 [Microvirga aerilata]|uniref:Uncharacterized protein n=2 Tax=Microvirga aerilata TaxID=670292 RepID=A0A936ZIG1_9HYPH|nr:hypothetical protein [Microvirga aerilata]MBL0406535.1 hypothetical protein [Microvirga aerilata]
MQFSGTVFLGQTSPPATVDLDLRGPPPEPPMRTRRLLSITCAAFLAMATPASMSHAEEKGPTYSSEQILNFELAGLKLNMTDVDAAKAMTDAGYEGKWDQEISDYVKGWQQVDRAIFPFRYIAKDGKVRLWSVKYKQIFDVNMSEDILKAKITEKYGEPTKIENGDLVYESPWPYDKITKNDAHSCIFFSGSFCKNNPFKSKHELEVAYNNAEMRPQLRVSIGPKELVVDLNFRLAVEEAKQFHTDQAKAAEEEKRRKASKNLDLGL